MIQLLDLRLETPPLLPEFTQQLSYQWGKIVFSVLENPRHLPSQIGPALAERNAALEEKCADLVDHTCTAGDQTVSDTVDRLEIKLIRGLNRNEAHGRALHSF